MKVTKKARRNKIKRRIRASILGDSARPRLSVFRSNKEIYAQLIDDLAGTTLASASSLKLDKDESESKTSVAKRVGEQIAQAAQEKNITQVVFDRNGYLYHGRVKALADGAREAGLKL